MGESESSPPEIYRFPEFFPRLKQRGALRTRDVVESQTMVDGLVYHHRGLQIPATNAIFYWEPDHAVGPAFRLEIEGVGSRYTWARFDATCEWDVYLMLFEGGAIVSWMTDREFEAEEAEVFDSKTEAIIAGRFSFGTFFVFGPDWVDRENWALTSDAPALIQSGDGRMIEPATEEEFYKMTVAIPEEFRKSADATIPSFLGLIDAGFGRASDHVNDE